mgnify:CR=1 FL=1
MNEATKWELVSLIISSEYRKEVLRNLDKPKTPTTISKELKINKTHISKTLKELESKNLITCLSPNANKGKLYLITGVGKEILKEVSNL